MFTSSHSIVIIYSLGIPRNHSFPSQRLLGVSSASNLYSQNVYKANHGDESRFMNLVREMPSSASLFTYLTFRGGRQTAGSPQDQVFCKCAAAHRPWWGPQGRARDSIETLQRTTTYVPIPRTQLMRMFFFIHSFFRSVFKDLPKLSVYAVSVLLRGSWGTWEASSSNT